MSDLTHVAVDQVRARLEELATGAAERKSAHWIHSAGELPRGSGIDIDGEATNFCLRCARKKLAEIRKKHRYLARKVSMCVDGGWSTDHDSPPYCHTCGATLEGSLTDHGVESEIEHFASLPEEHPISTWGPNEWADLARAADGLVPEPSRAWETIGALVTAARQVQP